MRKLPLCMLLLVFGIVIGLGLAERPAYAKGFETEPESIIHFGEAQPNELRSWCFKTSLWTLLHVGGGVGVRMDPESGRPPPTDPTQPVLPLSRRTIYLFDINAGMRCGWNRDGTPDTSGFVLIPQIGYSMQVDEGRFTHLAKLGMGVGYGNLWATATYMPRITFGTSDGKLAVGLRHGLMFYFLYDLLGVELSHQVLFTEGHAENDLRVEAYLNLIIFVYLAALAH